MVPLVIDDEKTPPRCVVADVVRWMLTYWLPSSAGMSGGCDASQFRTVEPLGSMTDQFPRSAPLLGCCPLGGISKLSCSTGPVALPVTRSSGPNAACARGA